MGQSSETKASGHANGLYDIGINMYKFSGDAIL